jgi:predicted MFS family arabinose efflux permease
VTTSPGANGRTVAGYRQVLANRVTRRLLVAATVSVVGDFIGGGALLVLAFERSGGRAVAAAGFLAATGLGGLAVALGGAPLLDRVPRRGGLVASEVIGAVALLLPLVLPGLWPMYVAAVILGARRSAEVAIRHGLLADAVPERLRSGLLGLLGTTDQLGQVVGYLTGASMAVLIGARSALTLDLGTFVLGAVVLAGLPVSQRGHRDDPPSLLAGWRTIFSHPQLRLLTILVVMSAAASALPESLASAAVGSDSAWLPLVLAAGPAGGVVGFLVAGRLRATERFGGQLVHLTLYGVAVLVGFLASGPLGFTLVNVAAGAGSAWIIGPQVSFVRLAPAHRMSQIAATMAAMVMVAEGTWVVLAGIVADAVGVTTAYLAAALVVLGSAVAGWIVHVRRGPRRYDHDPGSGAATPIDRLTEVGTLPTGIEQAG